MLGLGQYCNIYSAHQRYVDKYTFTNLDLVINLYSDSSIHVFENNYLFYVSAMYYYNTIITLPAILQADSNPVRNFIVYNNDLHRKSTHWMPTVIPTKSEATASHPTPNYQI
jgi:hypothetical protein